MTIPEQRHLPDRWIPGDDLDFGERLRRVRWAAGNLTLREAAAKCGLHYKTWQTWEAGTKPQDMARVVTAISSGLGVDRDWLAWGEIRPDYDGLRLSREHGDAGQGRFSGSDVDQFCAALTEATAAA